MICGHCQEAGTRMTEGQRDLAKEIHARCRGGTWCCCAHQVDHSVLRADRGADPRRGG